MGKIALMSATALRSVLVVGYAFGAAGAVAQTAPAPAAPVVKTDCLPTDPSYDRNTGNCVQPPEGTPGQTAPGTNPGTTPADEEPTADDAAAAAAALADDDAQIVVTGSRIPRPQFEGTIPGAQVTQEQIETRAFNSAIETLNDIPLVGPGASPFGTNGGQPGSLGAAFVDLLDLGTNRTLTLVNGRRFVSGNQGTLFVQGNTTGSQVDLNVIPTALIARMDVLTVGGAAAYGSDAIAGVVNAILVDDYDGYQVGAISGISDRGDGFNWRVTAIAGKNFFDDRANVTLSYEHVHDDSIRGVDRDFIRANPIAPTNFANGSVRNPNFSMVVGANTNAGTGAFLPTFADEIAGNVATEFGIFGGTLLVSPGGTVFAAPASVTGTFTQGPISSIPGTTLANGTPTVPLSVAGNAQIVPGVPINNVLAGCSVTNLTTFCNFAPTALPGTANSAAQIAFAQAVITQFAPSQVAVGTQAQRNALAVQLLQANRPTPREFFAANPTADINAFLGSFTTFAQSATLPPFLTIPTTGPNAGLTPRTAVPLRFNNAGELVSNTTCLTPDTPGTLGGAPCATGFDNPANYNILRTEQDRDIANLFAHFDITPGLTVYTEGLFARVKTVSPQNTVASANSIASTSAENGALVFSINNPFLDADDRATLIAAGVNATTGQFLVSRTNQDLAPDGDNPITNLSKTYRLVGGVKGDFDLFGQNHVFDTSLTWGRNDSTYKRLGLLDVEYALALDAVVDPDTGNIVCRSQIDRAGALGTRDLPRGIASVDIIRTVVDGVITEQVVTRTVTDEQIAQCVPFNAFGFGQASEAARNYVTGETRFDNRNDQLFAQASLAGSILQLPGGKLGYALSGDYRKDKIDFQVDPEISRLGRSRSAVLARTQGTVENYEFGVELRVPIFGDDFNIPLFRNLDFTPAVRWVRQKGDAPDVRLLSGDLLENEVDSGWDRIYSLAASWRPVRDITFRGNITRSIRQPSVVELFLGGQPAFNAFNDPCDNRLIGGGNTPDIRRANCQAAVIAAGYATDEASADTFLATFLNDGTSRTGAFAGSPDLAPERGKSWTVGAAANPGFIPGLRLSADYISVKLLDRIIPTTLTQALQLCYDDPNFPDTASTVGVNVCNFFARNTAEGGGSNFQVANGFNSGFINLGALQVNALNMTMSYNVPINDWFSSNIGSLELYANAYHLINYKTSSTGDLNDKNVTFDLAGDFTHATWEVQGRVRYEHPSGFYGQWTTNWQNETCAIGTADVCTTIEEFDLLKIPAFATHDASIGWRFGTDQRFNFQIAVSNVFDKNFAVASPQALALGVGGIVDQIGRRYRVSTSIRF